MKDFLGNLFKGDKVVWIIYLLFCTISIIGVFSATSTLAYKTGNYWAPIKHHVNFIFGGFFITWLIHKRPYKEYRLLGYLLYFAGFCFLVYVLFFGQSINGAARYASVLGYQFQPSELMKFGLIVVLADLMRKQVDGHPSIKAFKEVIIVSIIAIMPIFPEDLSTAFIMSMTVFAMMVIGQIKWGTLFKLIGAVLSLILIIHYIPKEYKDNISILHRASTWESRITNFTKDEGEIPPEKFDTNKNGQEAHANIAIASSSFFGKGPGNSIQRDFLSQAYSDFIFAIIIEEYGLVGALFVMFLYYLLLVRIYYIASECNKNFPTLMIAGIGILIAIQALFNMMVAVGFLPITGQPLPFISRGGTSFLINSLFIATILSVSIDTQKKKEARLANLNATIEEEESDENKSLVNAEQINTEEEFE